MSHRVRILLVCAIVLVLGIEVAIRWVRVLQDLRRDHQQGRIRDRGPRRLSRGESGWPWVMSRPAHGPCLGQRAGKGTLTLSFKQKGNPVSGFLVDDFDARQMQRDGLKMVLEIKPNEVQRYMEDDDTTTGSGGLGGRISDWISAELHAP